MLPFGTPSAFLTDRVQCLLLFCMFSGGNDLFVICAAPTIKRGREEIPVRYKVEILQVLKAAGYNTTRLRREKLLAENTIQQIREGKLVSWANIPRICFMLQCQPGDIWGYAEDTP